MDIFNWVASNVLGMADEPMLCREVTKHVREETRWRGTRDPMSYTIPAHDVTEIECQPTGEVCDTLVVKTFKCDDSEPPDCYIKLEYKVECTKKTNGDWWQQVKKWQEEFQPEVVRKPSTVK